MLIFVFLATVLGASYFLIFNPDSQFSVILLGLMPLGWLGLFALRFFAERKKNAHENAKENSQESSQGNENNSRPRKKFKDPTDYMNQS